MKILMVLNSHHPVGGDASGAGVHAREFAVSYYLFRDAGAVLTLATRFDARADWRAPRTDTGSRVAAVQRFAHDADARAALAGSRDFDSFSADDFDAVFYPTGHATGWPGWPGWQWRSDH